MSRIFKSTRRQSGATAIEYALLASLIAVVIIAGATLLGGNINTLFNNIATCISTPASCPFGAGGSGTGT